MFVTTGSFSPPTLWLLGHIRLIVPTNGYFVPFSSEGLLQPWNTLSFPSEPRESLVQSDCIVHLRGKRNGMHEPLVLTVMGFGTHRVTHRAGYPVLRPIDCTMAPPPPLKLVVGRPNLLS